MSPTSYLFTFEAGPDLPTARPGQFVNVAVSEDLTLRRPFSVAGIPSPGRFDLLVETRGKGTRALAEKHVGAIVGVLGPLGNEFTLPDADSVSLLVAGGIGVAGLRLLAQELRRGYHRIHALVGARTSAGLLHHVLPPPTGDGEVLIETATDDGSEGFHGTVTGLLERVLGELNAPARVYCCGPPAMIAAAADVAAANSVPCEALLEEMMACGVGACRGCVVATRSGYKSVCSDGPVFDTSELVLEELVRV
ncbi:MAG: dihydroorotate dehydrogenase electron transfer subunit [Candidatus Eisenbacteria bacterium]|nr:dihydroorotate dehydrogenase electron transfer subunit [Candidatus Eisenbacteria bacterium]